MADGEPGERKSLASEANDSQQENIREEPTVLNDTEGTKEEDHVVKESSKENAVMEVNKESTGTKVDVKYNFKATPTMESVLTEYGLPEDRSKKAKKKQVAKPTEKEKKKRDKHKTWTEDREETKTKQKEEHYSQVYKDVYRMRDYYYAHYMDLLKDKIEKQRRDIKEKSQQMEDKILQTKEKEEAKHHKVQKRLEQQNFKHDDTFLQNLPKSRYYKIVALQDKLRDQGELRTVSDFEQFWTTIDKPGGLERYVAASNKTAEHIGSESHQTRSHTSLVSETASQQASQPTNPDLATLRQLTQITETSDSRPTTTREWAVTHQAKHQHKHTSHKQMDPYTIARQAAIALDKQYPQLELPAMSCFTMELGERPPDPEEVIKRMEAKQRDRERKLFVARLRKMYQLAVSNTASANRILDKHVDDFELALDGAHIEDFAKHAMDYSLHEEEKEEEDPKPWLRYSRSRGKMLPIQEVGEEQNLTVQSRSSSSKSSKTGSAVSREPSAKHRSSKSASRASRGASQNVLVPLTMDNLSQHTNTMDAQCLSTFWTNYAKAGKSVFAKS